MPTIEMLEEEFDVFVLNISNWTGQAVLRPQDIDLDELDEDKLAHVASLGTKWLVNPKVLRPAFKHRNQAMTLVRANTVRLAGGLSLCKRAKTDSLVAGLEKIRAEYDTFLTGFLATVEEEQRDWAAQHPEHRAQIEAAALSRREVASRYGFHYAVFRMKEAPGVNQGLAQAAEQLDTGLLEEIAAEARLLVAYLGRAKNVTQKVLNPYRRMRTKLGEYSFLNPEMINPIIAQINATIDRVKKTEGAPDGDGRRALANLALVLSDPATVSERIGLLGEAPATDEAGTDVPAGDLFDDVDETDDGDQADGEAPEDSSTIGMFGF